MKASRLAMATLVAATTLTTMSLRAQEYAEDAGTGPTAAPTQPAPSEMPQMPAQMPPPPSAQDEQNMPPQQQQQQAGPPPQAPMYQQPMQPASPSAPGQWVYTSQYGWVFMPYSQSYTYVDAAGELAFAYAYYPAYGWRWLPAPWVLGWGPTPYWGRWGYSYFAWHAHPWFSVGVYRPSVWSHWGGYYGGYHAGFAPGYHGYNGGGAGWHGAGPSVAPVYHGPAGGFHPAPAPAAHPAFGGSGFRGGAVGGGFHGGGGGHHR